jgi:hypothetical protein
VNGPPYSAEPTLMQLVTDLVSDAKELLRQELVLAKYEITQEVHKTKSALISLGAGVGIISVGGLLLLVMLVHALNALTGLPLWACYGIIGGMLAIVGILLIYSGKKTISQIDMIPQQTVATMKENVRWIKEKAISNGT